MPLVRKGDTLENADGRFRYSITDGVVDLRAAPERFRADLPWFDVWKELDSVPFGPPTPLLSPDLPYHLDAHLASIPGDRGDGRWIIEIGCGDRQCDPYFTKRGFNYVGTDIEVRGRGPHVLADAHNLPFADASFDFYTSMAVYQHLTSPLLAAMEARRVLKPGGTFFGTSVLVYGFHDKASFNHMTHGAHLFNLRMAGFRDLRVWPDWTYPQAIPQMAFPGSGGWPWRVTTKAALTFLEWSYVRSSNLVRRIVGKHPVDVKARGVHKAGSLSYVAYRTDDT